jgi:chromosome segregation ATPase
MAGHTIDELHACRDQLKFQLNALRLQHADIARDVQRAEEDWHATLPEGQDVALLTERRRDREIGLRETSWAIEKIRGRIAEIEAEIRRRVPDQALDRDLEQLVTDLQAYDEHRAQLDGAYQVAINKVADIAKELHELVWTTRRRHAELDTRARNLRATAQQLGRPDGTVPAPRSWSQPIEQVLRGTGAPWRAYLTSVRNHAPEPFAHELGAAAAAALVVRRRMIEC